MTQLKRCTSSDVQFQQMVLLLDQELAIRDGADHSFYHQFNTIDDIKHAVVATHNLVAIGCGAIKPFTENTAEVKRMFVLPAYRKKGIASNILNELENFARQLDYQCCILETGKKQPEAIALYQKQGYVITENYGQYAGVVNSVCMKKDL